MAKNEGALQLVVVIASDLKAIKVTRFCTSLVVQGMRICLSIQGTPVRSLGWEDPTGCRAVEAMRSTAEPVFQSQGSEREATAVRSPCIAAGGSACSDKDVALSEISE